jgi:DNA polymerase-3 subunit delta'
VWETIIGQDRAVEQLRKAVERPVHSYLLVGPRGSGVEEATRCFAAELIGATGDDRVLRGRHPDVVEFRPVANQYSVERDVRAAILPAVHASPIEGERKCVVLFEADRLNDQSANTLLKSIEEPPERTIFILVAESAGELLDTVRSRCQEIDFGSLPRSPMLHELERRGVEEHDAELAVSLAGGRLDRAVALLGPLAGVRAAFADVPYRVDGTGATALALVEGLTDAIKDAQTELQADQERELEELEAEIDQRQYTTRTAQAMRRRVTERQRREERRAGTDALLEGLTALESVYRDALAGQPLINRDRAPLAVAPRDAGRSLDVCQEMRAAFEFNPGTDLLLERLVLSLAPAATRDVG